MMIPSSDNSFYSEHIDDLSYSFRQLLGYDFFQSLHLNEKISGIELAQAVFEAPFVIVSHGMQDDPIFNYGNQSALKLFSMSWQEFTQLASRYSAEMPNREERQRLLNEVKQNGYIKNYRGIRIAKSGERFYIDKAIVWNVFNRQGEARGQAAFFDSWQPI